MIEAEMETIGYRYSTKSEWISTNAWRTIEERRQMTKKLLDTKSPRLKESSSLVQGEREQIRSPGIKIEGRTRTYQ